MFNDGLPGELAVNALTRFPHVLITRRPGAVLLLEGTNDLSNDISVSRTVAGLRAMLDAAAAAVCRCCWRRCIRPTPKSSPEGSYRHKRRGGRSRRSTSRSADSPPGGPNVFLVDLEPLMANRALVGNDGIHLEDAGFEAVTAKFMSVVEAAFPVRGSFQ